jgi:hypothetical protein
MTHEPHHIDLMIQACKLQVNFQKTRELFIQLQNDDSNSIYSNYDSHFNLAEKSYKDNQNIVFGIFDCESILFFRVTTGDEIEYISKPLQNEYCLISGGGTFKTRWDLIIIALSLYNVFITPV